MGDLSADVIRQLEQVVHSRHLAATRAIQVLRDYLTEDWASIGARRSANPIVGELISYLRGEGSIRQKVTQSIAEQPRTIEEIVAQTGLTMAQVRGVLYAKDLRGKVSKDRSAGLVRFALKITGKS